ncbi:universal stress protein [Methylocystis sp.]|uniref:universal stress protein n=1 Tax=Methylocystis sp. TaxID=1911079 RepID=UPI003DA2B0FE
MITPGSIVLGYDRSQAARRALAWAATQAALENRVLSVVHVITPSTTYPTIALGAGYVDPQLVQRGADENAALELAEARDVLSREFPDVQVETVAVHGTVARVLVDLSRTAACVVVGSHGYGRLASLLLGSVGFELSRTATCPVFVIRPNEPGSVRGGIIVGSDGEPSSAEVIEFAFRQASLRQLALTVVYCVEDLDAPIGTLLDQHAPGVEKAGLLLSESGAGIAERFPDVTVRWMIGSGSPADVLVRAGSTMDLIVVGHHHDPSFSDVVGLGSVAPEIVQRGSCPVAVVCAPAVSQAEAS